MISNKIGYALGDSLGGAQRFTGWGRFRKQKDMSDKKGHRTMTLADFIKVFNFDYSNLDIAYFGDHGSIGLRKNTYFSKAEVEHDYCAAIYTVLDICPVDESTVQVVIWQ